MNPSKPSGLRRAVTVSYTHLDVYKRQDETRNAADIIGIIGCVGTEENPQIERIKLKREREWDMNKEWSELNKTMQAQIKKKNTYKMGIDTLLGLRRELIPLKLLQIDASVGLQIHAFPKKQKCLFGPVRREPPRVVDDTMTGKMAIICLLYTSRFATTCAAAA